MPLYNASGGTVKGAFGGYVEGKRQATSQQKNEIANAKANAEFLHYVDTRALAKDQMRKAATEGRMSEKTEESDTDLALSQNKTKMGQEESTRTNQDQQTDTDAAVLQQQEEEAKLAEQNAVAQQTLVKKQLKITNHKLDEYFTDVRREMRDEDVAEIASSYATIREAVINEEMTPEEGYQHSYNIAIQTHPRGPQYAYNMLQDNGITPAYSEEAMTNMQLLAGKYTHDQQTMQAEHLNLQKWQMEMAIEKIKASSATGSRANYYTAPLTAQYRQALGVKLSGVINSETWRGLEGKQDDKTQEWSGAKGQLVNSIADISRTAAAGQRAGEDPTTQEELQTIMAQAFNLAPDLWVIEEGQTGVGINNPLDKNKFYAQGFEAEMYLALDRLKMSRELYFQNHGVRVPMQMIYDLNLDNIKARIHQLREEKKKARAAAGLQP